LLGKNTLAYRCGASVTNNEKFYNIDAKKKKKKKKKKRETPIGVENDLESRVSSLHTFPR
jgi:hypothetical protein